MVATGRDSTACYPRRIEATRLARSANPTRFSVTPTRDNVDSTWCCPYLMQAAFSVAGVVGGGRVEG
jgi:hypothetical protein